jgi:hypothetical protein
MPTCPNGHASTTDDFCDQCGSPIDPPAAAPSEPREPAAPAASAPLQGPETCPHCGAPKPSGALFCEACGYDYTTGALPSTDLATALGLTEATPAPGADAAEAPDSAADPESGPAEGEATPDSAAGTGTPADGAAPPIRPVPSPPEPVSGASLPSPSTSTPTAWVAEVWIDPDWYAVQSAEDPMPPAAAPTVFPLASPALVGRHSESRNIHPQVDCGADSGCSRRQAELTELGGQWYITDLDSANGTFVAPAGDPLPENPVSGKTPVGPDDRIYVGAWTRLVVRPAADGELEALAAT